MRTWHVDKPTDKDIQLGLHCGEHGYVVALDRNERVVYLAEDFEAPTSLPLKNPVPFDTVLTWFPNGIYFASAS